LSVETFQHSTLFKEVMFTAKKEKMSNLW